MAANIVSLIREGIYSDFEIKVDNKTIKTHRFILASQSDYFKLLFEGKDVAEEDRELTITGHKYEIVDNLIMFCYTKVLKLTNRNIHETLRFAHAYNFGNALYRCGYYMDHNRDIKHLESLASLMPCLALDWIYLKLAKTYCKEQKITLDSSSATYELLRDMAAHRYASTAMGSVIAEWYKVDPHNRYDQADSLFRLLCFERGSNYQASFPERELIGQFEGLRSSIDRAAVDDFSRVDYMPENSVYSQHRAPQYAIDLPDFVPDSKYTDFTISIDGKSIKTHKIVLIANSGYFADLLRDAEGKCESLTIRNHRFGIVESLVNLCYTEELPLNESNIEQTLLCAHEFKFKEALNRCAQYITFKPSVSLFIYISRMKECPTLGRCYYDLIRYYSENFGKIKDQNGILEKLSYDLLKDFAQNPPERNRNLLKLFSDLVIDWYKRRPKSRINHLKSLIHQMDVYSITRDRLYSTNITSASNGPIQRFLDKKVSIKSPS